MSNGRTWTKQELDEIREMYPHMATRKVAEQLGRTVTTVYQTAQKLGLRKTAIYLASPDACRLRRGDNVGKNFRFKPGQAPPNKGRRMPGWAPGRMAETQFKPGQRGNRYLPIGTERIESGDGYLQRKVTDHHGSPRDWKSVHVIIWEEAHGPVPKGHAVIFRDRDRTNFALDNLACLSRAELLQRNSAHRWGPDVFQLIQLRGAINRKINQKARSQNEKQDVGPSQPSL